MASSGAFAGRVAFVTGGTRGIGAAITRALARADARLYSVFRSNADAAAALSAEVGGGLVTVRADVADAESAVSVVERVARRPREVRGGAADRLLLRATPDYVRQTRALAHEVGAKSITVNCVAPGWIDTELSSAAGDSARARALEATPVGRTGTTDEVAEAVPFLASERAAYVTGTVLQVNGGLYM